MKQIIKPLLAGILLVAMLSPSCTCSKKIKPIDEELSIEEEAPQAIIDSDSEDSDSEYHGDNSGNATVEEVQESDTQEVPPPSEEPAREEVQQVAPEPEPEYYEEAPPSYEEDSGDSEDRNYDE